MAHFGEGVANELANGESGEPATNSAGADVIVAWMTILDFLEQRRGQGDRTG
jgi:hypothetical protein